MWVAFANAKATHIFSAKINCIYAIFNDQRFNNTLTNIVSFAQLGPDTLLSRPKKGYQDNSTSYFYYCGQGYFWDGPDPFCVKTFNVRLNLNWFLAGPPIQAIQIQCLFWSQMGIKESWAHQKFQRAHENLKRPIKFYMYLNWTWALGQFQGPILTLS